MCVCGDAGWVDRGQSGGGGGEVARRLGQQTGMGKCKWSRNDSHGHCHVAKTGKRAALGNLHVEQMMQSVSVCVWKKKKKVINRPKQRK